MVIDDHRTGDISADTFTCLDLKAGGAFVCSYANVDRSASGAFGNGPGDAVDPSRCAGATLVNASGTINEGPVARVGQSECANPVPTSAWRDRWIVSGHPKPPLPLSPTPILPTGPSVDTANLPSGSRWTGQSIHVNAAARSQGASLSNACILRIQ